MFRWREGQPPADDPERSFTQQHHQVHGRIERRRLTAETVTPPSRRGPGARKIMPLGSIRTLRGKPTSSEHHCGVTRLSSEHADADALLQLMRGHWGIENRLLHIRDVTLGEDASRVPTGQAPRNPAMLRHLAVSLLNLHACPNQAAALRRHAARPEEALAMIHAPPTENETALRASAGEVTVPCVECYALRHETRHDCDGQRYD